jgi:uncharacterized NAD(P)/FAD-binding protein YdhS
VQAGEVVLAVGTGLTMADMVLAGMDSAAGGAVFHAISRHGLVPPGQTHFAAPQHNEGMRLVTAAAHSLRQLVSEIRTLAAEMQRRGSDWRAAIVVVREIAADLWRRLPPAERGRFLRHARCYWDIHRHRLPESVSASLADLRFEGKLNVHAGRIVAMEPVGAGVRVAWRPRGSDETRSLRVDRIINCTGPDYDARHTSNRLLGSLLAQGTAVADPLGLGLLTNEHGALVDTSGRAHERLYYLGPMLRPTWWETTAVSELSRHAERLARHLSMRSA